MILARYSFKDTSALEQSHETLTDESVEYWTGCPNMPYVAITVSHQTVHQELQEVRVPPSKTLALWPLGGELAPTKYATDSCFLF
jgi:hypothetical protein